MKFILNLVLDISLLALLSLSSISSAYSEETISGSLTIGHPIVLLRSTEGEYYGTVEVLGTPAVSVYPIGSFSLVAKTPDAWTNTLKSAQQLGPVLAGLPIHGSHHRPLLLQNTLDANSCAWLNGDFAHYTRNQNADTYLAEVGVCHDFATNLRAGVGLGKSHINQDLPYSGDNKMDGSYLLGELDYRLQEEPIILSVTVMHGKWDATIDRGYLNLGIPDFSRGTPDVSATSLRLRADWEDVWRLAGISLSPKAEYIVTRTEVDGYTEIGGGFPATVNSQSNNAHELRLGVSADNRISDKTTLRGIFEVVHLYDNGGSTIRGQISGLVPFSVTSEKTESNWLRIGGEFDYIFGKNKIISATLFGSSKGEDPNASGAISLKIAF